jgi:hypothetical protein
MVSFYTYRGGRFLEAEPTDKIGRFMYVVARIRIHEKSAGCETGGFETQPLLLICL